MSELYLSRRGAFKAAALAAASLGLAACGNNNAGQSSDGGASDASSDGEKTYKIGVLQLTQHAALDQSNKGFIQALDDAGIKYEADQQNASGDQNACTTAAEKFVGDSVDLIYAIATPAAQACVAATTDIPIVGAAITDFAASGLVASNDAPGGNLTGASDLTPVNDQIDLLKQLLPDAKKVGLLFCTAESNSELQVKMAEEALDGEGIEHERYTVSSSNEIQQVVESMVGKVDVIYAPTDNTIAAGMATVAMVANEHKIPTIVGCDTMVEDGGLASYSINYTDLGVKAGKMAVKILTGESKPADMPIEYLDRSECKLIVNQATADACGVDISGIKADQTV